MKRSMPDGQVEELAREWIDALRRGEEARDDQVHQSVVMLTFFYTPEVQWKLVLAALQNAGADEQGHIAAGPFEGLMGNHEDVYIDRVEAEAAHDPAFRQMIGSAWQYLMSDAIWARVQAAAGLAK